MMISKLRIVQILIIVSICLISETVSYFLLKAKSSNVPFLLNINYSEEIADAANIGFDEIDPLCGWAMSDKRLQDMGYEVEHHCVVFKSSGNCPEKAVRIFITGGSTSDMAIDRENWPKHLNEILSAAGIKAVIYVAATGGYNSGQELLKLLNDGLEIKPDIHISYSGANEEGDYKYTSLFENDFYRKAYNQSITTFFLPNTVLLIKNITGMEKKHTRLKKPEATNPYQFMVQNLKLMQAVAREYDYLHIGILQPVLGIGNYKIQSSNTDQGNYTDSYKKYYPGVRNFINEYQKGIYDFTGIFDTATRQVFYDDCHINRPYQKVVAQNVYETFKGSDYLKCK